MYNINNISQEILGKIFNYLPFLGNFLVISRLFLYNLPFFDNLLIVSQLFLNYFLLPK